MTRENAMKVVRLIEQIEGLENALEEFDNYLETSELDIYLDADKIDKMRCVIEDTLSSLNEKLKEF